MFDVIFSDVGTFIEFALGSPTAITVCALSIENTFLLLFVPSPGCQQTRSCVFNVAFSSVSLYLRVFVVFVVSFAITECVALFHTDVPTSVEGC